MRRMSSLAAALLVLTPGLAQAAAEPPCLTPSEVSALVGYALPSVIRGATQRCTQSLEPDSYLRSSGHQLAERYRVGQARNWPLAKAAFVKLGTSKDDRAGPVLRELPDESLQEMVNIMFEGLVSQEIPLERCATIDRVVHLLSPLPPENTAELIALTVGLSSESKDGVPGDFRICSS